MTIKKDDGLFVVHCDNCPEELETEQDDFNAAREFAKTKGWKAYRGPDREFANSCPSCVQDWVADQRAPPRR